METVQWTDTYWPIASIESMMANNDMTWLWIVLLALGGIGFIVAGLGVSGKLSKRQQGSPPSRNGSLEQSSASLPLNDKYCPQCGTANPQEAGFCIKCGFQFPSQ